jgi:hypothetical protein
VFRVSIAALRLVSAVSVLVVFRMSSALTPSSVEVTPEMVKVRSSSAATVPVPILNVSVVVRH